MDTIYTITGGGWFRDSLNAIATFFQMKDWETIMKITAMISVVAAAMSYIRGKDVLTFIKWAAAMVLVTGVLIQIKRPVQIIDLSNSTQVFQVDNVPVGITLPFSLITSVGHALVVGYETVFHQPSALTYSKTGMLFGADLMGRSTDFLSTNAAMSGLFSDYVQNCVVGDMLLNHKYSLNDLMNSTDPYSLIFSRPSPLRGVFDQNSNFQTCQWAAWQLQKIISTDTSAGGETWTRYVRQIFGKRSDATSLFGEVMGDSYRYFYGASQSASDIMKRNVTLSALRKGIPSFAARNGDTASLVNLSSETSYSKLRVSQATAADIATKTLPIMQTVLTGVLIGLFPLVMALALMSVLTLEVLKGYVYSIAYLQSWPLLFAILNNAMNFYLQAETSSTPVTLSNLSLIQQQYSDIGTTAGWLALSIPFLAGGLIFGLHKVMSQAGSYLGSALQSASSQSSSQAVDGTWAFNNMQTDNVQGSKWDTNSSYASGQMTTQTASGATKTITNDGNAVYNSQSAVSKLATDINFGKTASSTAQRLARESDVLAENALQGYNRSVNSAYNQAKQFTQQHGNSSTITTGADSSQSTTENQAINQMLSASSSYAERNNVSESQAWNELHSRGENLKYGGGVSVSTGVDSAKALWGKPGALLTGANGKLEFRGNLDKIFDQGESKTTSHASALTMDNSSDRNAQDAWDFRQGMDVIQSYRTNAAGSKADNSSISQLEQFSATLSESDSLYQQYTSSRTRSQEYSEMASASDTTSATVQSNYTQEFVAYVIKSQPENADSILTNTENSGIRLVREELANKFMEENMRSQVEGNFNSNISSISSRTTSVGNNAMHNNGNLYSRGSEKIDALRNNSKIRTDNDARVDDLILDNEMKTAESGMQVYHKKSTIEKIGNGLSVAYSMAKNSSEDSHQVDKEQMNRKISDADRIKSEARETLNKNITGDRN